MNHILSIADLTCLHYNLSGIDIHLHTSAIVVELLEAFPCTEQLLIRLYCVSNVLSGRKLGIVVCTLKPSLQCSL